MRNIAKIRKYLSQDTCKILVHAFISSKLDHCNSLLHGLPKYLLARLQAVQNAAARVVTLTPRSRGTFQDKREVGGGVLGSFFGGMCCWPLRTPTCVDLLIFKSSLTRIFVGSFLMDNAKRGMNL